MPWLPWFSDTREAVSHVRRIGGAIDYDGPRARTETVLGACAKQLRRCFKEATGRVVRISLIGPGRVVTDLDTRAIAKVQSLVTLKLEQSGLTDEGLRQLAELRHLRELDIQGTAVTGSGFDTWESSPLQWLVADDTQIDDVGALHVAGLRDLQYCYLGRTRLTDFGVSKLLANCRFKDLRLRGTAITDHALAHIQRAAFLNDLDVSNTEVTGRGVQALQGLTKLSTLDVSGTHTPHDAFVEEGGFASLRSLIARRTRIPEAGVKRIARLPLQALYLSDAHIVGRGFEMLAYCRTLLSLSVSRTSISDHSVRFVSDLPELTNLFLDHCDMITDNALLQFRGHPKLRILDVRGTHLSSDAIEDFKAATPGCYVMTDDCFLKS